MHLVKIISAIEEYEQPLRSREARLMDKLKEVRREEDALRKEVGGIQNKLMWLKKARKTLGEMYDEQSD